MFKITQHKRDEVLLTAIKEYFNCGYCYLRKKENVIDFKTTKFSEINEIIIPFFINNPMGRSPKFWLWSSIVCLLFGAMHLIGIQQQ